MNMDMDYIDVTVEEVPADTPLNDMDGGLIWLTLHRMADAYPQNPSPWVMERMKQLILSIPLLIRCESCGTHATTFIEGKEDQLEYIVTSRGNLIEFLRGFHNHVNVRQKKPEMTSKECMELYTKPLRITYK